MAFFLVKYIGQEGGSLVKSVDAIDKEEAISKSGVPPQIIQSVTPDHLGGLRQALTEKKLPINEQILSLVTIASKLESGKTAIKAINESVDFESLGVTREQLEVCEQASDFFKILKFDSTAILLAEAGDRAGDLADALKRAASIIRERELARKEFAKPMKTAVINFVVGIVAGIGFPMFGGTMIDKFINEQKLPLEAGPVTDLLMWLNNFYRDYGFIVLGCLVALFVIRARLWPYLKSLPVFQLFYNRTSARLGLDFIQTYSLLTASGYTNPQVFKFLIERSKGDQRVMYEEASKLLNEGRELGAIFASEGWPKIISQNLQGFEQQTVDGRNRILSNLSEALSTIFMQYSEKIATAIGRISMLTLISALLVFALGFYVPLMTMRPSL